MLHKVQNASTTVPDGGFDGTTPGVEGGRPVLLARAGALEHVPLLLAGGTPVECTVIRSEHSSVLLGNMAATIVTCCHGPIYRGFQAGGIVLPSIRHTGVPV